ncbi:MAG: hypothetical protein D8M59_11835 [Planctomycetes bacterium]|nr:hypothetical protein [Planctomycetota bacterium]NOG55451.1 hypothetical protein [Planctomycetota bacterium]
MNYVRFVILKRDEDSGKKQGLFQAMADLYDDGALTASEERWYVEVREWYNEHLPAPDRFSRPTGTRAPQKAISWYKDDAAECISRMREFVAILDVHGIHVEMLTTDQPGYVMYEDEYQVCAVPFGRKRGKK